jgi:hypothetical protein
LYNLLRLKRLNPSFDGVSPSFNSYIGQIEAGFVFTCCVLTMSDLNTYVDSYISEDEQAANDWWANQWEGYELTYQGNCVFIDGEPLFW